MRGKAERRLRLVSSSDERTAARTLLVDYLERTGLTEADFAPRIGYAHGTLRIFLSDRYHRVAGSSKNICRAIRNYIETNPILPPAQPFGLLYETSNTRAIRDTFDALIGRPVAYMLYGPPGSQKSFVLEHLVAEFNRRELACKGERRAFYMYCRVQTTPFQLMKEVAIACGSNSAGDRLRVVRNLRWDFRNRRILLVVDEAQHLSLNCFEALRELLDRPPNFSLLFAGSHDLRAIFDRWSSALDQWNSRIVDKIKLPGIEREEAKAIVYREIGDWLRSLPTNDAREKRISALIDGSMSKDAFDKGRRYLNVRTLSNALDQLKQQLQASTKKLQ